MIVIPAILVAIAEAAFIGGLAGAVICGMEDKRTLSSDAPKALRTAHKCAAEGALVGGAFGAVIPALGWFDDIGRAGMSGADDLARTAINQVDDISRTGTSALDDLAKGPTRGVRNVRSLVSRNLSAPLRREANMSRARHYQWLPKLKDKAGYVYVIDDVADGTRKIGITKNPAQRLAALEGKLGRELNYICIIRSDHMRVLERALHTAFAGQRLYNTGKPTNEWFKLSAAQVASACSV